MRTQIIIRIAAVVLCLAGSRPVAAQLSPTTPKAAKVRITQGPATERVDPDFAIIWWTCNNPGGAPVHYGVVRYGADPKNLTATAKSPIRLNPYHPLTTFRVRVPGLKPGTTYYYVVTSIGADEANDGVTSSVKKFSTPSAQAGAAEGTGREKK